jgi:hypothetical protein
MCECARGYFFPNSNAAEKYYNGSQIEEDNITETTSSRYRCTRCAPGCDVCTDASPCIFTRNVYVKAIILVLTIITIFVIIIASVIIFHLRENKVLT